MTTSVSARVPEGLAEKFERIVLIKRLRGEDVSKSDVIRECVAEYVAENEELLEEFEGV